MQAKQAPAKPAAAAKEAPAKPASIAPGKSEGAKLRTTGGQKRPPPVMKVSSLPKIYSSMARSQLTQFGFCLKLHEGELVPRDVQQ